LFIIFDKLEIYYIDRKKKKDYIKLEDLLI